MGEGDGDTPKLPIFSLPRQKPLEPPGMLTPPLHPGAAVPFQWEEAPGRPRPQFARSPYRSPVIIEGVKRCLDLPPGLLSDRQGATTTIDNSITIPSPTTILEGPYPCYRKRLTNTWSFRLVGTREKTAFGSARLAGFGSRVPFHDRKKVEIPGGDDHWVASGISLPKFFRCVCDQEETCSDTKVKITRVRRWRRSFLGLSPTKSHPWASIYEGFKQVVPWRSGPKNNTREEAKTFSRVV